MDDDALARWFPAAARMNQTLAEMTSLPKQPMAAKDGEGQPLPFRNPRPISFSGSGCCFVLIFVPPPLPRIRSLPSRAGLTHGNAIYRLPATANSFHISTQ
jgi:hypothetical protein